MSARPPETAWLATQVARLFFDGQHSKVEIAARLGISRFRVARLIDQALNDGLVRIEYRDVEPHDRRLAAAIERRWELDLCIVTADGGAPDAIERVARAAGDLVGEVVTAGQVVGIAWGSTLARVVAAVPRRRDASLTVVQLAGSSSRLDAGRDASDLARTLADRLGAAHHRLFAPTFVARPELRDALLREPEIAAAVDRFARLDLAIVGIGAVSADRLTGGSALLASGVLDEREIGDLVARGAVGDLVVHPFDRAGRFVAPELERRAVAVGIEQLRAAGRVLAVAAGARKAQAIRGALESGVVRLLVTDSAAAEAIVAEEGRPGKAGGRASRRRTGALS